MKKSSIVARLAFIGIAMGLISAVPSIAMDAMGDTTKPMMKKHHKHKKAMADSTSMAAPAAAPADTAKPMMKKHHKHMKAMADSISKM